jgi:hypothetical protein
MNPAPTDQNLLDILHVCQEMTKDSSGTLAGSWIKFECDRRGIPFHQTKLGTLVRMGYLEKGDSSRRGNRRYYRVTNA